MIKDLIPLNDKILVKRIEQENKTDSGIILTATNQELSQWAEVIRCGRGRILPDGFIIPLIIEHGWKVYLNKYVVQTDIDGYMVVKEDDVLGYLEYKMSEVKTVTNAQYLHLMNFFSTPEIEQKRLNAIRKRYGLLFVKQLPRDKFKECMKWLETGEWLK